MKVAVRWMGGRGHDHSTFDVTHGRSAEDRNENKHGIARISSNIASIEKREED